MFYSIFASGSPRAPGRRDFHESTAVEMAWTIVPFIIVVGLAVAGHRGSHRAEGHLQRLHDGEGNGLPVEVGLRVPERRRRGNQLPLQPFDAARRRSTPTSPRRTSTYLMEVDNAAGGAGQQEGAGGGHRRRRDPRLGGACARRQAGCDPRVRERHLVPRRACRGLSRPVRRAVRQGPRLHADRGRGEVGGRLRRLGGRAAQRKCSPRPTTRTRSGRSSDWPRAARRSTPPTASPATRRTARACPARSRRSTAQRRCSAAQDDQIDILLNGVVKDGTPTAMASFKQLSDTEIAAVITYTRNSWGNKAQDESSSPRTSRRRASRRRSVPASSRQERKQESGSSMSAASIRTAARSPALDGQSHNDAHEHGPTAGWRRWLFATNHKDIGTMYLWFSLHDVHDRRAERAAACAPNCSSPGCSSCEPEFFNQLTTMHGLIMVFGAIMPAFVGFANWQIPMMIGAGDMAFARMNNFSFWLLPPAALLLVDLLLRARRRHRGRLDALRAAVGADGPGHGPRDLRAAHHGRVARSWARSTSSPRS